GASRRLEAGPLWIDQFEDRSVPNDRWIRRTNSRPGGENTGRCFIDVRPRDQETGRIQTIHAGEVKHVRSSIVESPDTVEGKHRSGRSDNTGRGEGARRSLLQSLLDRKIGEAGFSHT